MPPTPCFCFVLFLFEIGSHCHPGWPRTHHIAQSSLEFMVFLLLPPKYLLWHGPCIFCVVSSLQFHTPGGKKNNLIICPYFCLCERCLWHWIMTMNEHQVFMGVCVLCVTHRWHSLNTASYRFGAFCLAQVRGVFLPASLNSVDTLTSIGLKYLLWFSYLKQILSYTDMN